MLKQYHILNGDLLREQFPLTLKGQKIVARACLVDGDVSGNNLKALYKTRAQFISTKYKGFSKKDYYDGTVTEFNKITNISEPAEINLWFEDDLFCQVNFWFVIHLLHTSNTKNAIFLVRPEKHTAYGFGEFDAQALISIFENKIALTKIAKLASLWVCYQNNQLDKLQKTAEDLELQHPFILNAVKAHIARTPSEGKLGKPMESLLQIIKELKTEEFAPVFKEFCKREPIYGFGDLQVRRLFDTILEKQ